MSMSQVIDHQANKVFTRSVFWVNTHPALFKGKEVLAATVCYQEGLTKLFSGENYS